MKGSKVTPEGDGGGEAARRPRKRFEGPLNRPIKWKGPPPYLGPLLDEIDDLEARKRHEQQVQEANEAAGQEQRDKLWLLCDHYGIDTSDPNWPLVLAYLLACDFVPGMRIEPTGKRGSKQIWTPSKYSELLADIEAIKRQKKCGDRDAIRHYLRRSTGKRRIEDKVRSFESRLVESRQKRHNAFVAKLLDPKHGKDHREYMIDVLIKCFATEIGRREA